MTLEETLKLHLEIRKESIRIRLHKLNPKKYPAIKSRFSPMEIMEVAMHVNFNPEKVKKLFERDNSFWKYFK